MQKIKVLSFIIFIALIFFMNADAQSLSVICDEWPPYQIVENDEVSGFSTEIVKTIFQRMEYKISKIDVFPWKRALMMIEKGQADALFSANYTEDRTSFARYPDEPLFNSIWVMWVKKNENLKFDSFEDLEGKHVGIVRGYSYTPEFLEFIKKNALAEEVTNDESNFKKLDKGRVDYIVAEIGNGLRILKQLNLKNIVPLKDNPVKSDGLYIIFNKKRIPESFVDQFSNELKKFKDEPAWQNLYYKYLSSGDF